MIPNVGQEIPPIARRLKYIQDRLEGKTPEEVIEQVLDGRVERLNEQIKEVALILLERQNLAEQNIQDLVDEAELLQMLKPAEIQMERLHISIDELSQTQTKLKDYSTGVKASLERKTKDRLALINEIHQMKDLIHQSKQKDSVLEAFFCQAAANLSTNIRNHFKNQK